MNRFVAVVAMLFAAACARPGDYKAQRFDVVARAVDGGLEVIETITFEFQSGTFKKAWREIPVSRTDGVTIVGATMDGAGMTQGDGPGHISVTSKNRKQRVDWHFAEIGPSVHRFQLHYVVRGLVYREGGDDVIRWRALPQEHEYRIDASRIHLELPGADIRTPETRRVGSVTVNNSSEGVTVEAEAIQSNGWIIAEIRYGAGQLIDAEPQWQQRDARAREMAPKWAMGGAAILVTAVLLLVGMRRGYAPPGDVPAEAATTEPPEPLPAALASALTARGTSSGYQSIATILDLADRGALRVREVRRGFGRSYEISQVPGAHDLEAHEAEALSIAFADRGDDVMLAKARGRLARQSRRFRDAVNAELLSRGLIDSDRKALRDRLMRTALAMIVVAALVAAAVAPFVPRYRGWPFFLPLGLLVAGFIGIGLAATVTPLSDRGLVEAARWRGFKRHLKALASRDDEGSAAVPSRWIVYAIAAGLGTAWSRYLKRHPDASPPWFDSASDDAGASFAAFVGSHTAAGADGSAGAAGGGAAAGGGGSGAG